MPKPAHFPANLRQESLLSIVDRKDGFDLYDRLIFREGVNCLDHHRPGTRLDIDVADCSHRDAATWIEPVQQAFGRIMSQFFLNGPEKVCIDWFKSKCR